MRGFSQACGASMHNLSLCCLHFTEHPFQSHRRKQRTDLPQQQIPTARWKPCPLTGDIDQFGGHLQIPDLPVYAQASIALCLSAAAPCWLLVCGYKLDTDQVSTSI